MLFEARAIVVNRKSGLLRINHKLPPVVSLLTECMLSIVFTVIGSTTASPCPKKVTIICYPCASVLPALRPDDHGFQVSSPVVPAAKGHSTGLLQPHGRHQRLCERHTQHPQPGG